MSKDIKKALKHCIDNECVGCPNNEELGSGETVCRARLLPEILEYISDLQHKLEVAEKAFDNLYEKFKIVAFEYAKMDTIPSKLHFKEQAESELKGE